MAQFVDSATEQVEGADLLCQDCSEFAAGWLACEQTLTWREAQISEFSLSGGLASACCPLDRRGDHGVWVYQCHHFLPIVARHLGCECGAPRKPDMYFGSVVPRIDIPANEIRRRVSKIFAPKELNGLWSMMKKYQFWSGFGADNSRE